MVEGLESIGRLVDLWFGRVDVLETDLGVVVKRWHRMSCVVWFGCDEMFVVGMVLFVVGKVNNVVGKVEALFGEYVDTCWFVGWFVGLDKRRIDGGRLKIVVEKETQKEYF